MDIMESESSSVESNDDDVIVNVLDMLNFKVVSREPGDPGYNTDIPVTDQAKYFAAEYCRLHEETDKMKMKLLSKIAQREEELQVAKHREEKKQKEVEYAIKEVMEEKKKAEIVNQKVSQQKNELDKIESQLVEETIQLVAARKKIKELEMAQTQLQKRTEVAEQSNIENKRMLTEAQETIVEREKEVEEYRQANEDLRKQTGQLEQQIVNHTTDFEKIRNEKEELQEKLSFAKVETSQVENRLKIAQETISEVEGKLKEKVDHNLEYKTKLEEAQKTMNSQETQLTEAGDIIREQQKRVDEGKQQMEQLQKFLQLNMELDQEVRDLKINLTDKSSQAERLQIDISSEREARSIAESKYNRLQESLKNYNVGFSDFIKQLKSIPSFTEHAGDEEMADPSCPDTPQFKLESLSAHVQNKFKSWKDNQKMILAELTETKQFILNLNKIVHIPRRSASSQNLSANMPPPPPPTVPPPVVASSSTSSHSRQTNMNETRRLSYRDVVKPQEKETPASNISNNTGPMFTLSSFADFPSILPYCDNTSDPGIGMEIMHTATTPLPVHSLQSDTSTEMGCGECGGTFPTKTDLYQHLKTMHTVKMSKKVLQPRNTKPKKQCETGTKPMPASTWAVPKIVVKQRKTRNGSHWNIMPSDQVELNNDDDDNGNDDSVGVGVSLEVQHDENPSSLNSPEQQKSFGPFNPESGNLQTESSSNHQKQADANCSNLKKQHHLDETKSHVGIFCSCGKKFKSNRSLRGHISDLATEPKFVCKLCRRRFIRASLLRKHYRATHKKKFAARSNTKGCRFCGKIFSSMRKLFAHQTSVHRKTHGVSSASTSKSNQVASRPRRMVHESFSMQQDLPCPPDTEEINQAVLQESQTLNPVPKVAASSDSPIRSPLKTKDCTQKSPKNWKGKLTSKSTSLNKKHARDVSKDNLGFFCICGVKFVNKNTLLKHIIRYTGGEKFECNVCNIKFSLLSFLRAHLVKAHKDATLRANIYGCRHCGVIVNSRAQLMIHFYSAHGVSMKRSTTTKKKGIPAGLMASGRLGSQSSAIPISVKIKMENAASSTGAKIDSEVRHRTDWTKARKGHFCLCGINFRNKCYLQSHIQYHFAKAQFECPECKSTFKFTSKLKRHMLSKHKVNYTQHGCKICGQLFENTQELREHKKSNHRQKRRKVVEVDLTSVPTPAPSQEDDEDLQVVELDSKMSMPSKTTQPPRALPTLSRVAMLLASDIKNDVKKPISSSSSIAHPKTNGVSSVPVASSSKSHVLPNSVSVKPLIVQKTAPTPALSKKKHGVDLSKRHIGYYCICGTKVRGRQGLHRHIAYFTQERKFKCDLCERHFLHMASLTDHMKNGHKITKLQLMGIGCSLCGQRFSSFKSIAQHRKISHSSLLLGEVAVSNINDTKKNAEKSLVTPQKTPTALPQPSTSAGHLAPNFASSLLEPHCQPSMVNGQEEEQDNQGSFLSNLNLSAVVPCRSSFKQTSAAVVPSPSAATKAINVCADVFTKAASRVLKEQEINFSRTPSIIIPTGHHVSILPVTPTTSSSAQNLVKLKHAVDQAKFKKGLYFCTCGGDYKNKYNLKMHINYYNGEKKYPCPVCHLKFVFVSLVKRHVKRVHNADVPELSGCIDCGQVFLNRQDRLEHIISMHSIRLPAQDSEVARTIISIPSAAEIVGQVNSAPKDSWVSVTPSISVSLRTPTNGSGIVTLPDNYSTIQGQALDSEENYCNDNLIVDAHLTSEPRHGIDHEKLEFGYFCCTCGQDCSNKNALKKHVKYYSTNRKFICKTCGHGFFGAGILRNHMLKVHKIVYNISNGCKECGETFPTNMELYHHFRMIHNNGQQWEPREMKYTPPSQSQLSSQEFPMSQEQMIEVQNENFNDKPENSSNEGHGMVAQDPLSENGANTHLCKCGASFKSQKGLRKHIRIKKIGYVFQCDLCNSNFNNHSNLKLHVKKVHNSEYNKGKYACGVCAQTFDTREGSNTHRKTVHENLNLVG